MSNSLYLDCETMPNWGVIDQHWPLAADPPDFDPASVKYGNAKKPELREKILSLALASHKVGVSTWGNAEHIDRHRREMATESKATLNPSLSMVCAIGSKYGEGAVGLDYVDTASTTRLATEKSGLMRLERQLSAADQVCGWNLKGFDLPYLAFRYRCNGLPLPDQLKPDGRYYRSSVVDLMEVCASWQYGRNMKLKHAAVALGFPPSPEPDGGAFFWQMDDRARQDAYLSWDVESIEFIANRMGEDAI